MKTIYIKAQERMELARQMERESRKILFKKKRRLAKERRNTSMPNVYRLFVSGKPTDETREMMHVQAMAENNAFRENFVAKVREAIGNGGRYDGLLSQWRCEEHWSDKQPNSHNA